MVWDVLLKVKAMDAIELGDAIKAARKAQRLTQAELALRVGVSRHTIMQLESNTYTDLGIRKVMNVLTALGLSLQVGPSKLRRPTLEDVYEENERERREREAEFRKGRVR